MAASEGAKGGNKIAAEQGAKDTGKSVKHAHSYPGREIPSAEKVRGAAKADPACVKSGRENSLGVSANGSHKGLKK